MNSIAAILAFADMGLSIAIMQCAAHEHARIVTLQGAERERANRALVALLVYSIYRVGKIILIALPAVMVVGYFMLSSVRSDISWIGPWITHCIGSAASLMLSVTLSFYEGCDGVAKIQRIRLMVSIVNLTLLSLCLVFGLYLWSLPISTSISTAVGIFLISRIDSLEFVRVINIPRDELNRWRKEISPVLSKYALSWIGGYLMFQLLVPIVFKTEGPVEAGRVGLTFSIFSAIFSLSNVWSAYQLPNFSMAIAIKDRSALQRCFKQALFGSAITYIVFAGLFVSAVGIFGNDIRMLDRLQPIKGVVIIAMIWLLQLIVHNLAIYLRAFKEEPLVKATAMGAIHSVVATLICVHAFNASESSLGVLSVYIWFLPKVFLLYVKKRKVTADWVG